MNLIDELKWRGLISQTSGNLKELFSTPTTFYLGIDSTADSLGVHHIIGLMVSKIMQKYGHKPIILVGGATCAIGDPSGKSEERKSITMEDVFHNVECVKNQISKIIDFDTKEANSAVMLNNYDWMKDFSFLDFMREVGKKITVNYLMAKDNVKKRLERDGNGISCQEFIYGIMQGYDFVHLNRTYNCKLQIGGTDNLGNIVTGIDLLRKMDGTTDCCGLTWDLITTADGRKFGKTEGNTVWLDEKKTSPYEFMQFWINQTDADAEKFSKMFLVNRSIEEIQSLIDEHKKAPEKRLLQKTLAHDVTSMVHGEDAFNKAVAASNILFGKSSTEDLENLDSSTFNAIMRDVPKVDTKIEDVNGTPILDFLCDVVKLGSKTELRKLITSGAISINKNKIVDSKLTISPTMLLSNNTMLIQKGKKKHVLVRA